LVAKNLLAYTYVAENRLLISGMVFEKNHLVGWALLKKSYLRSIVFSTSWISAGKTRQDSDKLFFACETLGKNKRGKFLTSLIDHVTRNKSWKLLEITQITIFRELPDHQKKNTITISV
jgi:hypothetical protein